MTKKQKLINRIKDIAESYPDSYSDKVYDAVTVDEGIQEVINAGIRKGLEIAIFIIESEG